MSEMRKPVGPRSVSPHDSGRAILDNLASLNEIMAELVTFMSPDPEFAAMTVGVLRDHSWRLGYEFQGQVPR